MISPRVPLLAWTTQNHHAKEQFTSIISLLEIAAFSYFISQDDLLEVSHENLKISV